MKGKKYRIDKTTGKMVEVRPANEIPEFNIKTQSTDQDFVDLLKSHVKTVGMVSIPTPANREQERLNLSQVFDAADREAENLTDRRDTLRVQETIQKMRDGFLE